MTDLTIPKVKRLVVDRTIQHGRPNIYTKQRDTTGQFVAISLPRISILESEGKLTGRSECFPEMHR